MTTMLSLPPELHYEIFKCLPGRKALLSIILCCRHLHSSFLKADIGTLLERIRYSEIGCGVYADALIFSLRLMEPDIQLQHLNAWVESFHAAVNRCDNSWSIFLNALSRTETFVDTRSWKDWEKSDFYSHTSFCYFNRSQTNGILHQEDSKAHKGGRWLGNYKSIRLLVHQCTWTRLLQGFGEFADDYSRLSEITNEILPPTESELRRFERGTYTLWIMLNIAGLIHRPDFLHKMGNNHAQRAALQRNIRRSVISIFDVWDWRAALSIQEYVQARIGHLDILLQEHKTMTVEEQIRNRVECMWNGLPAVLQYNGNYGQISDSVMIAFSPPGAMRFFFADRIIMREPSHDAHEINLYGTLKRDTRNPNCFTRVGRFQLYEESKQLKRVACGQFLTEVGLGLIKNSISGFEDVEYFFRRIEPWTKELQLWDDIYTFYPLHLYPDRRKLPLETPRAIIKPNGRVHIRSPGGYTSNIDSIRPLDDGWAWKDCVDWVRSVWDDWRLEKYANYQKPRKYVDERK